MTARLWKTYSFTLSTTAAGTTDVQMLTYDDLLSRVQIDLGQATDGTEPAGSYWVVERSTDLVHWTPVRGGANIPIPES